MARIYITLILLVWSGLSMASSLPASTVYSLNQRFADAIYTEGNQWPSPFEVGGPMDQALNMRKLSQRVQGDKHLNVYARGESVCLIREMTQFCWTPVFDGKKVGLKFDGLEKTFFPTATNPKGFQKELSSFFATKTSGTFFKKLFIESANALEKTPPLVGVDALLAWASHYGFQFTQKMNIELFSDWEKSYQGFSPLDCRKISYSGENERIKFDLKMGGKNNSDIVLKGKNKNYVLHMGDYLNKPKEECREADRQPSSLWAICPGDYEHRVVSFLSKYDCVLSHCALTRETLRRQNFSFLACEANDCKTSLPPSRESLVRDFASQSQLTQIQALDEQVKKNAAELKTIVDEIEALTLQKVALESKNRVKATDDNKRQLDVTIQKLATQTSKKHLLEGPSKNLQAEYAEIHKSLTREVLRSKFLEDCCGDKQCSATIFSKLNVQLKNSASEGDTK